MNASDISTPSSSAAPCMVSEPLPQSKVDEAPGATTRGMTPAPVVSDMTPLDMCVRDPNENICYVNLESLCSCEGVRYALGKLLPSPETIMSIGYDARNDRRVVELFPDQATRDLIDRFVAGSFACNPLFQTFCGRTPLKLKRVTVIYPYVRAMYAPSRDIVQQEMHRDEIFCSRKRKIAILISSRAGVALKTVIDSHGIPKESSPRIGFADTDVFAFEISVCHAGPAETAEKPSGSTDPLFAAPRFFIEFHTLNIDL